MPKNDLFSFRILLGGEPVKEYKKDGQTVIMTNLMHRTTYHEERLEFVDGREERQTIPVTPYQVVITLKSLKWNPVYAKLYVDGHFVRTCFLRIGKEFLVKGFNDGGKIREFLFSLPQFGEDKDGRIEEGRVNKIGCIAVELHQAIFKGVESKANKRLRSDTPLDYTQATKADSAVVTNGKYTMATTKPGRCIEMDKNPGSKRKRNDKPQSIWCSGKEILSKLDVKYHMRHTLVEMGIEVLE